MGQILAFRTKDVFKVRRGLRLELWEEFEQLGLVRIGDWIRINYARNEIMVITNQLATERIIL